MAQCASCMHVSIDDNNSIKCHGLCGNSFHLKCLNKISATTVFNKTVINCLTKVPGIQWYCGMCRNAASNNIIDNLTQCTGFIAELKTSLVPLLNNIISTNSPKKIDTQLNVSAPAAFISIDTNDMRDEIQTVSDSDTEEMVMVTDDDDLENTIIAAPSNFADTSEPMDLTAENGKRKASSPTVSLNKRACNIDKQVSGLNLGNIPITNMSTPARGGPSTLHDIRNLVHAPAKLTKKIAAQEGIDLNSRILPQATDLNEKILPSAPVASKLMKSVCISRFSNDVTCEDILNHFRKYDLTRNIVNEIQCKRLTRGNRHISSYTFISFKLTFPRQYFERVTSREIWKPDAIITDFVDKRQSSSNAGENPNQQAKNWARQNGHAETDRNHTLMRNHAPPLPRENDPHYNPFTYRQMQFRSVDRTHYQNQRGYNAGNNKFY